VPVGPWNQPDYVNAAARLDTRLAPADLLAALQAVERCHGRVRDGSRWGPRTLDLDILLYGGMRLDQPGLHLPHAEMHRRAFVLVPLADIADEDLPVPGHGTLGELLAGVGRAGIERLPAAAGEAGQTALC
jgi:2-amino-4-hydroxy-6-hydroxymethyldihydropteridine diphosphokinase